MKAIVETFIWMNGLIGLIVRWRTDIGYPLQWNIDGALQQQPQ